MKTVSVKIWSRDQDASRWIEISLLAYFMRYPGTNSNSLEPMADPLRGFLRYGHELRVLEHDLTECINEFQQAHEVLYHGPEHLELKKFAIVYHIDNFYVRIHKFIEDVFALLGLSVGLDPTRKPRRQEPPFRELVRTALTTCKFDPVLQILRAFEDNSWIRRAVGARNLFVHRFREDPQHSLESILRFNDPPTEDELARDIRRLYQSNDLDEYASRKVRELSDTLEAVRDFRNQLADCMNSIVLENSRRKGKP
jgi:hypothetical protein